MCVVKTHNEINIILYSKKIQITTTPLCRSLHEKKIKFLQKNTCSIATLKKMLQYYILIVFINVIGALVRKQVISDHPYKPNLLLNVVLHVSQEATEI